MAADGGLAEGARAFVRAFADHAGRDGVAIALSLVAGGAVLESAGIVLLVPILTIIVARPDDMGLAGALTSAGLSSPGARLAVLLAGFVALMILRAGMLHVRDVTLARQQTGFVEAVRNRVVLALAAAPWTRVAGLRHARIANLLGADIARIAGSAHLLVHGAVAAVMLAVQAAIAVWLAPGLAGAVVAVIVLALAVTLLRARHAYDRGDALVRASQALMHNTTGFLGGLKSAVAENAQGRFVAEFACVQADMRAQQLAFLRHQSRLRAGFALGSAIAGAAVVWTGVAMGIDGAILATLILIFARMSGPAIALQGAFQNFIFGLPSFAAVQALESDLIGAAPAVVSAGPPPVGDIVFDGVTFEHGAGGGVRGTDLRIAPGEIVGIAGPSGSGKTTLVDLLAGLIVPQAGTMRIGGAVIADDSARAGWRSRVAYVAQDGYLANDTIRHNLTWGAVADDAAIDRALAATGADRVIAVLPDGLDTIVGERGTRLSGGERQRIAIARALLREPRLMLLDEATAAIDVAGEAALMARLAAIEPRPAIVIVAHRAETLAHCDRVIRVDAGRAG